LTRPPESGPEAELVSGSMEGGKKVARRHYRPEEIIAKLREAEVLLGRGDKIAKIVKELGIHEVTYYRWRKEHGGMRIDQM